MALYTYPDLTQRTDEWLTLRRGIVTASTVGRLITPRTIKPADNPDSRALTMLLVSERITGWTEDTYVSSAMWRGVEDEPGAVETYSQAYAPVETVGFMVRDDGGCRIGYSPDGLVGNDGLIEVKSRSPKEHVRVVIEDAVPAEHMAQLQCGLLVSGRQWVDYISYCGGLPMWVKRVTPDQRWHGAILTAVAAFEASATSLISTFTTRTAGLPATERVIPDLIVV